MIPTVAITGASGFLGRHLVEYFYMRGWKVRALVRRDPRFIFNGKNPIELVLGSLFHQESLERLISGVDLIVHSAGLVKATQASAFFRVNVEGSARLGRASARKNSKARLIFVSSMAARVPHLSAYAASKAQAESTLRDLVEHIIMVRPSAIYGPGDAEMLIFFKMMRWPVQPMLNGKTARIAMVHVEDAASAIFSLATIPWSTLKPDLTYEITDGQPQGYCWETLINTAGNAYGVKVHPFQLSPRLLQLLGQFGNLYGHLTRSPQMLTTQKVKEVLNDDWSSSKFNQLPQEIWRPQIVLEKGFKQTINWYRQKGWLA